VESRIVAGIAGGDEAEMSGSRRPLRTTGILELLNCGIYNTTRRKKQQ